ncbi:MAG TPA: Na+/H+ antiporter, partial [Parafilimonas sp.]|nr:Na+/H+ antiporter [Parafilimonas sp.]
LQKEENELNLLLAESSLHFINNDFKDDVDENMLERIKKQYEFNYNILANKKGDYRQRKESDLQLNSMSQFLKTQMEIVKFQRELLIKFQNEDRFSEEALAKAERELDIEELRLNSMMQKTESSVSVVNNTTSP